LLLNHEGRSRPSARHPVRLSLIVALAAVFAVGGLATRPISAEAAGRKVVIVVGPSGSSTANYIMNARKLAAQARSYGAAVYEIYSPYATWAKVRSVAQGASLFIYLGHGNGWPSPYAPFQLNTKDGIGLNAAAGHGNYNVKYWGEYYIDHYINLAPHAVVILNRLCYASGDSEWGRANPTRAVAIQRVDNYGAGFWRANAKAVFAEGIASAAYVVYGLFKTNKTMADIFWSAPNVTRTYSFGFPSVRSIGASALLDPYAPSRYYRSVIGTLSMTAATWRAG
jgi:hypothetical protein